jgi:septal ring factor EnvC (AmiA/AmiB activator)
MNFKKYIASFILPAVIVSVILLASSCRPMITPEQLQELKEIRAKEKSLTEQINSQKSDIKKIEGEIKARESELKDCNEKTDFVKQKLSQWPNSWPDWQPEQPETEGTEGK